MQMLLQTVLAVFTSGSSQPNHDCMYSTSYQFSCSGFYMLKRVSMRVSYCKLLAVGLSFYSINDRGYLRRRKTESKSQIMKTDESELTIITLNKSVW